MNMPTVRDINQLSDRHATLLLLRCLMATDGLTNQYMLFEKRTIQDIVDVAEGCLTAKEIDHGLLTQEETVEYLSHLEAMKAYTGAGG